MPRLSVCIEMFWKDLPLAERIRKVKALGFTAFEFWGWKDKDLEAIAQAKAETGLALAVMSMEPNWVLVTRANDQGVLDGFAASVTVARRLGCQTLIAVPGFVQADGTWEQSFRTVRRKLKAMARIAEEGGVTVVVEPLNPLVDHAGAWLTKMSEAYDLVREVASPNVKILMDMYHQQVTEGNLLANLAAYAPWIGHVHAAGVPGRHELVGGELDYRAILRAIDATGYHGYVGLEYAPTMAAEVGLKQALELA